MRIRVKAIGLNRAEWMWRQNKYAAPVQFPARIGYQAADSVDSVGKDVTTIAVGDEVNTIPSFSMNQNAMYGESFLHSTRLSMRTAILKATASSGKL